MNAWVSANPILAVLAAVIILICIICGLARLLLRGEDGPRDEAAEFDADLDETSILELTHDELPIQARQGISAPRSAPDTVRPDNRRADDATAMPEPPGLQYDQQRAVGLPDMQGMHEAVPADLTPKQRRRAVHKGRIPRDLPAPPGRIPAPRGGESTERLISGILAAELDAGRWLAAEADRAREEETLRERAELDARIDEAYRVVGAAFAALEARDWLELAA